MHQEEKEQEEPTSKKAKKKSFNKEGKTNDKCDPNPNPQTPKLKP